MGSGSPDRCGPGCRLSDGFYLEGPLVHPLTAIGPMIPFASVPGLVVQPESWFELGNPGDETICIDLAYDWPGGSRPIFTSGDDLRGIPPRIIAPCFDAWFLAAAARRLPRILARPRLPPPGRPLARASPAHPRPPLPDRLKALAPRVLPLMHPGADDRAIATELGITALRPGGDLPPPPARPGRPLKRPGRALRARPDSQCHALIR